MPSNIIRKMRRASIRDVAKAASVSTSTVSLVLNRNHTVRPETRQRVEQAMNRLGYRPRAAGRPIVRGRGQTIAIVYGPEAIIDRKLALLAQAWTEGICEALGSGGCRLCSMVYQQGSEESRQMLRALIDERDQGDVRLDGVISIGSLDQTDCFDLLLKRRLPLVVMNRRPEFGEYSHVSIDNYGSMLVAIDYLVELGHRRIALVGAPGKSVYVKEREKGAADAFERHGIQPVYNRPFDPEIEGEAAESICREVMASGATALLTGDYSTIRFFDHWQHMGVRIPDDLSVLGFDDLGVPTPTGLRITSVGYDKYGMGELAAEALLEILQDTRLLRHRSARMATRIVEGDTTRPFNQA